MLRLDLVTDSAQCCSCEVFAAEVGKLQQLSFGLAEPLSVVDDQQRQAVTVDENLPIVPPPQSLSPDPIHAGAGAIAMHQGYQYLGWITDRKC